MDKPLKKEILFFAALVVFVAVLGIIFFPSVWLQVAWVLLVGVIVYFFILRLIRVLEMTDLEKIRVSAKYAEEVTRKTIETMPLGTVGFDVGSYSVLWQNPYADYVFAANNFSMDEEEVEKILALRKKGDPVLAIGAKKYYFDVHEKEGIFYFMDVTKEQSLKEEVYNRQLVIGTISVDNYDDATENLGEKERSLLNSNITAIISDWLKEKHVYTRRLNAEKFIFVTRYKTLREMMQEKFKLLDDFRTQMKAENYSLTLSMGIGYGMSSVDFLGEIANNNLEVALVRGGDQVVVKDDFETSKPQYFGGKSESVVRRTRVRTRAMATALEGVVQNVEEVYIMGHRFPDLDSIGASFGMLFLSKLFGKESYVILEPSQFITDVKRTVDEVAQHPEMAENIRTPQQVINQKKKNALLIMVDYNKPSLSVSKKVYGLFDKVVIIDHHRRSEDFPVNPLLSYIESGASSASELITELIQYQSSEKKRISRMEATLLMAGIVVDTKSFQSRTTSRTFDTASFLRSMGADNAKVQSLLSSDLNSYMAMNELIANNEYITEDMVLGLGSEDKMVESDIQAKAADTMLSMSGIAASFVISKRLDGKVGISARSKGDVNVQLIMEKMEGGGHFNNAAVQKEGVSIQEMKEQLIKVIQENKEDIYS